MISVCIASLILAATTIVNAVPVDSTVSLADSGILTNVTSTLNSTVWYPGYILRPDEVLLVGNGRMEVIHETLYNSLIATKALFNIDSLDSLAPLENTLIDEIEEEVHDVVNGTQSALEARGGCVSRTNTVTDTTQHFVGWDVQMSPIVYASGPRTTITVTQGYSISNAVTVGVAGDNPIVKEGLKAAFKVDYQRTWTSSYSASIMSEITPGHYGTMVSKPTTTRRYGRVLKGCVGAQKVSSKFMADSFDEGQHAGIKWVAGVIQLCQKTTSPLTRCNGAGTFK